MSKIASYGPVCVRGDERNAVAPQTPRFRMTTEGVGETFRFRRRPQCICCSDSATWSCGQLGRLQALVARAPVLRPLHSLLDLAGGLGRLPFGAAFLLPLAHGRDWPALGALLGFGFGLGFGLGRWRSAPRRPAPAPAAAPRSARRPAAAANIALYIAPPVLPSRLRVPRPRWPARNRMRRITSAKVVSVQYTGDACRIRAVERPAGCGLPPA